MTRVIPNPEYDDPANIDMGYVTAFGTFAWSNGKWFHVGFGGLWAEATDAELEQLFGPNHEHI